MSCAVAPSFSSVALLSSFVSKANLSCLLATTFASLSFLSNSLSLPLSSPRFNILRVSRRCFLWFSVFLFSHLILGLSLLSSVSEALFALSFPFLRVFVHAKAALAYSQNE